jgi:hypothetical protein
LLVSISTTTMESSMEAPQRNKNSQAPVAHACNPSYSGGRDQEDQGPKPAQTHKRPYLRKKWS